MNSSQTQAFVEHLWDSEIVPQLTEYIRIPNQSPAFDPEWEAHGFMEQAVQLMSRWASAKLERIPGASLEVVRLEGRTPLIYIEVPEFRSGGSACSDSKTVMLYGHLDKQPEMTGWAPDLGPWKPVLRDEKLYGRGGADDGYAIFASLGALLALHEQGVPHARCVILIEACEESGSYDLPAYVDHLSQRIGSPSLVVCLDSGCANYDQLWLTTSLRGMVGLHLRVDVLTEGVHSGDASGIVPDSFRLLRQLISRLEDEDSGQILPLSLAVDIPLERVVQAEQSAEILGAGVFDRFPFVAGMQPVDLDPVTLILNRTWRAQLAITGIEGLPPLKTAGNVLRPMTAARLSLRLPPSLDARKAAAEVVALLEQGAPNGCRVSVTVDQQANGWNAPRLVPWLEKSVSDASMRYFGKPSASMGEGGSIPFMGMLGEKFPAAQFLITGVLGPHSNAHGPNEFLHIPTAKRLTCVVAEVLAEHFRAA
ncbi:Succinyl-diaminopimelate desuccinylase [gamma proteobacterium HdN1]|nr:Succinyl-diaminopimelate desuccinylase [gamma proteobacterium HdN1]